jgi:hypothetical protein
LLSPTEALPVEHPALLLSPVFCLPPVFSAVSQKLPSLIASFSEGFGACFPIFVFPRPRFFLRFSAYARFWFSPLNLTQACRVDFFLRSYFSGIDSCPLSALLSPVQTSSRDFLAYISLHRSVRFVSFSTASSSFLGQKPVPAACAGLKYCSLLCHLN